MRPNLIDELRDESIEDHLALRAEAARELTNLRAYLNTARTGAALLALERLEAKHKRLIIAINAFQRAADDEIDRLIDIAHPSRTPGGHGWHPSPCRYCEALEALQDAIFPGEESAT